MKIMNQKLPELSFADVAKKLQESPHGQRCGYLAMYSSWLGGIVRDPQLMFVPVDDHIVHRGDGVFEAIKSVGGKVYGLDRHLERLYQSANKIGLVPPVGIAELKSICLQTARAAGKPDVMLRLFVSRGPGGFTTNPYECIGSQIYLVITAFQPLSEEKYQNGVTAKTSSIKVKEGFFANVKSCNYLPNVLMKKEAVDAGVDFAVSRDERGHVAEGSTENFAIISREGEFRIPAFDRILRGVTAVRMMELAEEAVRTRLITAVKNAPITETDVFEAREAMFLGTTLDVLPVTVFDGKKIGDGKVGPVCREFLRMIRADLATGAGMVTEL